VLSAWVAGREPALIGMLIGIGIRLFGSWLDFSIEQQALVNAAVAAAIGLIVALSTKDGQPAAILGLAQAFIALTIGFGLRIDSDTQAMIMSAVALVISMYERTQITAPTPPEQ
jgi:hypothetical protein